MTGVASSQAMFGRLSGTDDASVERTVAQEWAPYCLVVIDEGGAYYLALPESLCETVFCTDVEHQPAPQFS